jgi:transcriptional regulator GlxA family with amidase domain
MAGNRKGRAAASLRRRFRKQIGVSFGEYLKRRRLAVAAELLRMTTKAVKEIAFAVGYTQTSNFTRDFRECYGRAPIRV